MHITKDSRKCSKDSVYFCFIGEKVDGHDYILDAVSNGASKIIGTKDIKHELYEKVDDINIAFSEYAMKSNNFDQVDMKFVGITGTDGKTSSALIIDQLINKDCTSSYLGTSGFYVNRREVKNIGMTTPFADELFCNIAEANQSSSFFVMEVSSHALKQKRVHGLNYDVVIFTNFTNDHLDYHKTKEDYLNSKLLILDHLKDDGYAIINSDMDIFNKIKTDKNIITFGTDGDFKISNIKEYIDKTVFDLTYNNKTHHISSPLLASFNAYNLTCAIATLVVFGIRIEDVIKKISNIYIDGRLNYISNQNSADVILDFAHTPDSISKVMEFIKNNKNEESRVCVVTGSAGGRDHSKRPAMGFEASKYSDILVLTMDDPRDEDVLEICNELKSGVKNPKCKVEIIVDRIDAIKYAFKNTSKNDIIVCLGKSGQNVMYVKDETIEYDEYKEVLKIIEEL